MDVFLPIGYPESVSDDYMAYQIADTVQALASGLSGTLATHAVLTGLGVGDAAALPASATVSVILRDGFGMVGRIGFAWLVGPTLDADAKTWRLMADVTNDLAMSIDLVAPHLPRAWFLGLMCLSSVVRAVTGVAGGATRTAVTSHQARNNNISDVAAKDGSQETAVNLIAMCLGMVLVPILTTSSTLTFFAFLALTALHLYANYRGVKALAMPTLNRQRLQILFDHHFASSGGPCALPSPEEVARCHERVLWFGVVHEPTPRIRLADTAPPHQPIKGSPAYIVSAQGPSKQQVTSIHVHLREGVTQEELLRAYFEAMCQRRGAPGRGFERFKEELVKAGWTTSHVLLCPGKERY